jgi:hypothetical protein
MNNNGDPWIAAIIGETGKYHRHTWMMAESTGWRQLKRRERNK